MSASTGRKIGEPFNPWKRFNGVFIPLGLLTYPGLSDRAKLFYGRLCFYAGKEGNCFAGRVTMATDMGVNVATITRLLNELTIAQFIRRKRRGPHHSDAIEFLYHSAFVQSEKTPIDVAEMRDQDTIEDVAKVQHQGIGVMLQIRTIDVANSVSDDVANSDGPYKEDKIQTDKIHRQELQPDDSRAFRKTGEKSLECSGLPSSIPNDGKPRNGLTPVDTIAAKLPSTDDINALKTEMQAIIGKPPTPRAMEDVRQALGEAQDVAGFARHLRDVHSRYRPGGSNPVGFFKWFVSAAQSFAATETPSTLEGGCRHGRPDGACSQCLRAAEFNEIMEAF